MKTIKIFQVAGFHCFCRNKNKT